VTLQSQRAGKRLACPRCGGEAPRSEWLVIFRNVTSFNNRLPALRVLKHRPCKQMVYFFVE
jgi:hypothetical protein